MGSSLSSSSLANQQLGKESVACLLWDSLITRGISPLLRTCQCNTDNEQSIKVDHINQEKAVTSSESLARMRVQILSERSNFTSPNGFVKFAFQRSVASRTFLV